MLSNSPAMKSRSAPRSLRNSARRASSVDRMRVELSSTSLLGDAVAADGAACGWANTVAGATASSAAETNRAMRVRFMGLFRRGVGTAVLQVGRDRVVRGLRTVRGIGRIVRPAAEHVLADHLDQVDRGLGQEDRVAGLERLR